MRDKLDLSELIGSRICHDLISPIGAIGNGVELLLSEMGTNTSPELALIAESVAGANARLRLFRFAFGAGGNQRVASSEVMSILNDMTHGGRLRISCDCSSDLGRREVRLMFLLLMCLESALPWGGQVAVRERDGQWRLAAEASRIKLVAAHWRLLAPDLADLPPGPESAASAGSLSPSAVQYALAAQQISDEGRALSISVTEQRIALAF